MKIKVSYKSLLQEFNRCSKHFIQEYCHGACCDSSNGLLVTIHPTESEKIINNPYKKIELIGNFLKPIANGRCPFKTEDGLCILHDTQYKPFGCIASPFTLNKNNTLIVRNRYRLLKCYRKNGYKIPAYMAHAKSLIHIFGENTYSYICEHVYMLKDCYVDMNNCIYNIMRDNDIFKLEKKNE